MIASFLGGLSAHFIENEVRIRNDKTKIRFWKRGFIFTCISCLGGLSLIRPVDAGASFLAGATGWYTLANFIAQKNKGLSLANISDRELTENELQNRMKEERD